MKVKYRMRRTTKQYIIVAFICIVIIGGAASFTAIVIMSQVKEEYNTLLSKANDEINRNQRTAYVAVADIAAGDIITEDMVKLEKIYSSQPQGSYITKKELGKLALIDIPVDTGIISTMVTDNSVSSELREVEYQVININSNIVNHDTVDVRLFFPNGEDYVVLTKKVLRGYDGETTNCRMWLSEEEIISIRNAIVDAYLYTGAFLYTTKYIEPNVQDASIVTYTPSVGAIELIQKNPNIYETATNDLSTLVRKALENRLTKSLNKDVTSKQWELFDDNIYQQYNEDSLEISPEEVQPDSKTDSIISEKTSSVNEEDESKAEKEEKSDYFNLDRNESVTPSTNQVPETGSQEEEGTKDMMNSPDLGSKQFQQYGTVENSYFMLKEDE